MQSYMKQIIQIFVKINPKIDCYAGFDQFKNIFSSNIAKELGMGTQTGIFQNTCPPPAFQYNGALSGNWIPDNWNYCQRFQDREPNSHKMELQGPRL